MLESFHSRLLDPRVADLFLYRVKEVEGYHLEANRKLGKAQVRLDTLRPASEGKGAGKGKEGKPDKHQKSGPSGGHGS